MNVLIQWGFLIRKCTCKSNIFASWIIIKVIIIVRQLYGWGSKYCSSKVKPYLPPTIAASLIPLDSGPANLTRKAASGANGAANLGLLV